LGAPKATTAMANQLGQTHVSHAEVRSRVCGQGNGVYEKKYRDQYLRYLKKQAAKQGFQHIPVEGVVA
jgi:hypothetical protein